MTELTKLDEAHAAMQSDPEDSARRLRYYDVFAATELFLMLQSDAENDAATVSPTVVDAGDARYVLVFDREERLAAFAGDAANYVALSGRSLVEMLAGQNLGLGLNLEVAPSAIVLPSDAVDWLHEMTGNRPDEVTAQISEVLPPRGLPQELIQALDAKLATAMGLATAAYLVQTVYRSGGQGHLLAFVGALPQAEEALAGAASEALTFSSIEAGALDIGFFRTKDPICEKLERVGLRFDLPQLQNPVTQPPSAPGMDPAKPPKLK